MAKVAANDDVKGIKPAGDDDLLDEDVKFLAEHTDLSPRQAAELIEKHGRDRAKLIQIAKTMKAEG